MRFIGHLGTARALMGAVRRAGIEVVYSQGITPRMRVSFGGALALGCTSDCEFFDIKLARRCQPDSIREGLQSHLPEGFFVEEVQVLEGKPRPLTAAFWAAEYEIELPGDFPASPADVEQSKDDTRQGASGSHQPGSPGNDPASSVVRASWREKGNGVQAVSIVLRHDGGGLKKTISGLLGVPRESLDKCRIHKKRVYAIGEEV